MQAQPTDAATAQTAGDAGASAPGKLLFDISAVDRTKLVADRALIEKWNPHRHEMALLDGVVWHSEDLSHGLGVKRIRSDEFWVRGHFPGVPLMPGVLMCEAAAQLSSYYTQKHNLLDAAIIGFGGMEDVRFREPVVPGDRLVIAVERVRVRPRAMIVCRFQGLVRESIVVDGTIKGVPLPVDALQAAGPGGQA